MIIKWGTIIIHFVTQQRGGGKGKISNKPPAQAPKEITSTTWAFAVDSYEYRILDQDGEDVTDKLDIDNAFMRSLYGILAKPAKIAESMDTEIDAIINPLFEQNAKWLRMMPPEGFKTLLELWEKHGDSARVAKFKEGNDAKSD